VINNPNIPWNWEMLSLNNRITEQNVRDDLASENPKPWSFRILSYHWNISEQFVKDFPDKDWDFKYLVDKYKKDSNIYKRMILEN
jgi:hypothetical protein